MEQTAPETTQPSPSAPFTSTIPTSTSPAGSKRNLTKILAVVLCIAVVGICVLFMVITRQKQQFVTEHSESTIVPVSTAPAVKGQSVALQTGYVVTIPDAWTTRVGSDSKEFFSARFFVPGLDEKTSYLDIESGLTEKKSQNPLLRVESKRTESVHSIPVVFESGKEVFAQSQRHFSRASATHGGRYLTVTLMHAGEKNQEKLLNDFISGISLTNAKTNAGIFTVHAAEAIDGVPMESFKETYVMADPQPETITRTDLPYKDGFAKAYVFTALKGQRLTIVAQEEQTGVARSYIATGLFDANGDKLYSKDTRTEFIAPYTGKYYAIVHTFGQQVGTYFFKIFDRDQTQNLVMIKREDGSEQLVDPASGQPPLYGEQNISLLVKFMNPISIDGPVVRYVAKPQEFEPGLGPLTSTIAVYISDQTYEQLLQDRSELPENNESNKVPILLQKLDQTTALISPAYEQLFQARKHIVLTEKTLGSMRVFTLNPGQVYPTGQTDQNIPSEQQKKGTSVILGRLTEAGGQPPTKKAPVELTRIVEHLEGGAQRYETIAVKDPNADGSFVFEGLIAGEYQVAIAYGEYNSYSYKGWSNPILLSEGERRDNIYIEAYGSKDD